jgi:hypothetical protein
MTEESTENEAISRGINQVWIVLVVILAIFMASSIAYDIGSRSGAIAGWNFSKCLMPEENGGRHECIAPDGLRDIRSY